MRIATATVNNIGVMAFIIKSRSTTTICCTSSSTLWRKLVEISGRVVPAVKASTHTVMTRCVYACLYSSWPLKCWSLYPLFLSIYNVIIISKVSPRCLSLCIYKYMYEYIYDGITIWKVKNLRWHSVRTWKNNVLPDHFSNYILDVDVKQKMVIANVANKNDRNWRQATLSKTNSIFSMLVKFNLHFW